MPPRKRASSVLNGEADDLPRKADRVTSADDALAAADEADAEAAEAEAVAAAARARARAIRLRREAAKATAAEAAAAMAERHDVETTAVGTTAVVETVTPEPTEPSTAIAEFDEPMTRSKSVVDADPPAADHDEAELAEGDPSLDEDGDEDDVDATAKQPVRTRIAKAVVVSVALVGSTVLLVLSGAMYWHHREVEAQRTQTAEFAAAARQGVVTLMSLNFNDAKDDVQRIIDNTTGEFKKDFQGQADSFIKVAENSKVITEANVNAAAVQSMGKDTATVLVAVTTNVSNKASDKQEPRSWRLMVGMTRDGDQIKLSKVEFVP
jgi:Mce-associated membrane protein